MASEQILADAQKPVEYYYDLFTDETRDTNTTANETLDYLLNDLTVVNVENTAEMIRSLST